MSDIIKYPSETLRERCEPIYTFDENLHYVLDKMYSNMIDSGHGIGLAAPQIGYKIRAIVIDIGLKNSSLSKKWEFINPNIMQVEGKTSYREGCLSLPGVFAEVPRYESITLQYQDRDGRHYKRKFNELMSIVIQHEIDHLDGILFIDHISEQDLQNIGSKLIHLDKMA